MVDEAGQILTGLGGIVGSLIGQRGLHLLIQTGLQVLGELEAVDHMDHDLQTIGCRHLKGSEIAFRSMRSTDTALIGGWTFAAYRDVVHRRAIRLQGNGLGRATVIG